MTGRLLRGALARLATATMPVQGSPWARIQRGALGLLLRAALWRSSLPALLASLDGTAFATSIPPEPRAAGSLRRWGNTCLYRSLTGYAALRAGGEDVSFVLGVRQGGALVAHAWLEVAGAPVGEPTDPRSTFAVAFRHPPRNPGSQPEVNVSVLHADPAVILTELQDGTGVLLHLGTKFYYALNRTGVVAWNLLSGGEAQDTAQLARALAARFAGVSAEQARVDLDALLAELEAEGLLAPGEPG